MAITAFQANELVTRANVNSRLTEIDNSINTLNGKFPVSIENGGTGGTTASAACVNLGIYDTGISAGGSTESTYITNVRSYFSNHRKKQVPMFYPANWVDDSTYGVAVGITPTTSDKSFLFIFNETTGPKFSMMNDIGTWIDYSWNGIVLYDNQSGTQGTVDFNTGYTLGDFQYIKVLYFCKAAQGVWLRNAATHAAMSSGKINLNCMYYDGSKYYSFTRSVEMNSTSLTLASNTRGKISSNASGNTVSATTDEIYIMKVIGYRY